MIYSSSYIEPDTMSYIVPAENFLKFKIFLDASGTPIWIRTPGYPLFLALIYWLADLFKINFDKNFIVLSLQALMCILNSCMIFYCVNKIINNNKNKIYGLLAVLFYILDLVFYEKAAKILTDVPFSFLITLSAFLFIKYYYSRGKLYAALSILAINYALW
ncbi:MAG: phospholipid carrier-dependent glycosyltransferase, partial [Synergistaceae bacterium]|nr:phospholipid carrier-dependent glycosyltransferase [Synergistaceae bacterium]